MKKLLFFLTIFFFGVPYIWASSAYLSSFTAHNGTLLNDFQKMNTIYTIHLNDSASNLVFDYQLEDESSKLEVLSNTYQENDAENQMVLKIVSEDGLEEQIYTFLLEKESDQAVFQGDQFASLNVTNKKEIPYLAPIVVTSAFCIIILLFKFLVYDYFKKKKILKKNDSI